MKKIIIALLLLIAFSAPALAEDESSAAMGGALTGFAANNLLFHGEPYLNSWERVLLSGSTGLFAGVLMGVANDDMDISDGVLYGTAGSFAAAMLSETANSYFFVAKSGKQFTIGIGGRF